MHVLLHIEFFYYWAISKVNKKPLSYGEEGDIEYFDCSADELRNDENATSLLDTGVRRRRDGSNDDNNDDDDNESVLDSCLERSCSTLSKSIRIKVETPDLLVSIKMIASLLFRRYQLCIIYWD